MIFSDVHKISCSGYTCINVLTCSEAHVFIFICSKVKGVLNDTLYIMFGCSRGLLIASAVLDCGSLQP